jgi:hypothetical protein
MVAFLFLFAPTVVLIAVLIMQRFQPRRDRDPAAPVKRAVADGRIEPRFGAVNDNTEYESYPGTLLDRRSVSAG